MDAFEQRAKERERAERAGKKFKTAEEREAEEAAANAPKKQLDGLSRPDMEAYRVDDMVGQRRVVTAENALSEQGGFYCEACDYLMKDQKTYLEHCNKPRHLQAMGMPMHMRRAGADDVKSRLALHAQLDKDKDRASKAAVLLKQTRAKDAAASGATATKARTKQSEPPTASDSSSASKKAKKGADKGGVAVVDGGLDFDPAMFGLPAGFGSSTKK